MEKAQANYHCYNSCSDYLSCGEFTDDEGTFKFNLTEFPDAEDMNKAHIQCDNLSGEYMILTDKSKLYEFESITTKGYDDIPVFIRLEPQ